MVESKEELPLLSSVLIIKYSSSALTCKTSLCKLKSSYILNKADGREKEEESLFLSF